MPRLAKQSENHLKVLQFFNGNRVQLADPGKRSRYFSRFNALVAAFSVPNVRDLSSTAGKLFNTFGSQSAGGFSEIAASVTVNTRYCHGCKQQVWLLRVIARLADNDFQLIPADGCAANLHRRCSLFERKLVSINRRTSNFLENTSRAASF